MKKFLMLAIVSLFAFASHAQTKASTQTDVKVKQTSSPAQRVHNTFSKHKRHNGVKVKGKSHGRRYKKVYRKEETEVKTTN